MGRVLTNNVQLSYTIESALGVAGTSWFLLEPNSINSFGADITKVARNPISKSRQRRKGTTTDLDSAVEFEADITLASFLDFIEGFCFSTAVNGDCDVSVSNVDGTADEYDVSALAAAVAGKLEFSTTEYATLIYARGFTNAANNGLKQLDADVMTSATAVGVTDTGLVDETPPANAQIELAGVRLLNASTDIVATYAAGVLTLTEQGTIVGFDWTDFGMSVGQFVHIGSPDANGDVQNALGDAGSDANFGYCRVASIAAQVITFDKVDAALALDATPGSDATLDILFGKFIRNVTVDDSEYLERSFQFEAELPNLSQTPGAAMYSYALGNYCNSAAFSLPLTDKAGVTFGFIGTDTENPVEAGSRKSGASTAAEPNGTSAFNTSSDIARLRITEVDETGITTDFKSLNITLNNNVSPEKVLGTLGAAYINTGNFDVDIEAQLVFTNGAVINKIRNNETVTMDFIINNEESSIAIDIPSMTMGGGGLELPVNESVLINTTGEAFEDATLGTSIGVSVFPIVPWD